MSLTVIAMQLQSCDGDDPVSAVACTWNDPIFCIKDGGIKFINGSTTRNIVRIYFVENCAAGWGNGQTVNIGPGGQIRYKKLDSGDKYNVKADWSDNVCDMKFGLEVPYGGYKEQILNRDPVSCNIAATAC